MSSFKCEFEDFREYIKRAEEIGELKRVRGADWNLEIGVITELMKEQCGPMLLFEKIKGYPEDYRIAANPYTTVKRTALALGMPLERASPLEMVKEFKERLKKFKPILPVEVKDGAIKENVHLGEKASLLDFPSPKWHELDGGRYIGTGCVVITRDPEERWVNIGTYRVQVHDKQTAGIFVNPQRHGRRIMEKYWAKGESCPIAVACGQEPALFIASYHPVPWGVSEYDWAGWLKNSPVKVVKGETVDLPIPATAEIVIEGEVPPPEVETRDEGPFGEYTGYYGGGMEPAPIIKVKAILHRDDPILQGDPPLKPPVGHLGAYLYIAPSLWDEIEKAGVHNVMGVYSVAPGNIVVSIKQESPGHAKKAGLLASACQSSGSMERVVIVVDDDIDPSNPQDVFWAVATRCDPETQIDIVRGYPSSRLDPRITPEKRRREDFTTSKVIINACKPYDWIEEFPPVNKASPNLRRKTMEKWGHLFR